MNVVYLTGGEVLLAGSVACEFEVRVGEPAQFEANVARPTASAFGADAFDSIWDKAAALLHAFATTQTLVDGNKRTAWAAAWLMLRVNGAVGSLTNGGLDADAAEKFMLWVARGEAEVSEIAEQLRTLDTSTRLPAGFVFDELPSPMGEGSEVLVGNGHLADGSARVYVYAINSRGLPTEMLLTAEQARAFANGLLEAVEDPENRFSVRFKVEQLITHHDIAILPRF